jgi:hypothetical protein
MTSDSSDYKPTISDDEMHRLYPGYFRGSVGAMTDALEQRIESLRSQLAQYVDAYNKTVKVALAWESAFTIERAENARLRTRLADAGKEDSMTTQVRDEPSISAGAGLNIVIPGLRVTNPSNGDYRHWGAVRTQANNENLLVTSYLMWPLRHERSLIEVGHIVDVTLVRIIGPRGKRMDEHDNLPASFKHVVDAVAACLGLPKRDNDPRLRWHYGQERGEEWGVRIEVSSSSETV